MQIYLFLIAFLLITAFICKSLISDNEKAEKTILKIGILAIFLILSLKKETVGIDIIGYKEQYLISQFKSWGNVDYVYFETGYIQLMKLFSKAGISFQWFTVFIYALLCTALYFFIKTVSENVTMSLLIFICFQFFVFSISALRQTIAMSLCMLAYLALKRSDKIINLFIYCDRHCFDCFLHSPFGNRIFTGFGFGLQQKNKNQYSSVHCRNDNIVFCARQNIAVYK